MHTRKVLIRIIILSKKVTISWHTLFNSAWGWGRGDEWWINPVKGCKQHDFSSVWTWIRCGCRTNPCKANNVSDYFYQCVVFWWYLNKFLRVYGRVEVNGWHTAQARYEVSNISDYSTDLERFEGGGGWVRKRKGDGGIKELLDTYVSGLNIKFNIKYENVRLSLQN